MKLFLKLKRVKLLQLKNKDQIETLRKVGESKVYFTSRNIECNFYLFLGGRGFGRLRKRGT